MTQADAVKATIEKLGGVATLGQINNIIFDIKDCHWGTKTPFATIRRIVRHTSGIYRIKPGLYGLEDYRQNLENSGIVVETTVNENSEEIKRFNHTYYQGLLLEMGNIKHYLTYAPNQDKNKIYLNKKIDEIRSLSVLPQFSYKRIVQRCRTVDVVWLNERKMPNSLFEVEHSTDIQNSLLKFSDLQDFNCRMFIVANGKRVEEFQKKMQYSAFDSLTHPFCRVNFLDYEALVKQYENTIQLSQSPIVL